LSRARCRHVFEQRFDASRMAREYVALYDGLSPAAERPGAAGIARARRRAGSETAHRVAGPCRRHRETGREVAWCARHPGRHKA
jgi:hypothetical protein